MAYTKQNFVDGKTLYASQLNHIEDGIVAVEKIAAVSSGIVCSADGEVIVATDASDRELKGLNLYGKTTQNGTPTPDAPVPLETPGADGNVAVTVCGKNLWQFGDAVGAAGKNILLKTPTFIPAGQYVFSATAQKSESPNYWSLSFFDKDGATIKTISLEEELINAPPIGFTLNRDCYQVSLYARSAAIYSNIQLESGSVATAYEPYKGQTLTISTPNGLPGIPVSSGGNYIDENGQMWICDEIDFARGKYVQRVFLETIQFQAQDLGNGIRYVGTATNNISPNHLGSVVCKTLPYHRDATVGLNGIRSAISTERNIIAYHNGEVIESAELLYPLASPIETDLTAEELAQYSALHTNAPNTTIYNDEGVGMSVDYLADTKLYIDKKFTELAAALVNN